jgi:hypothetical protein
MTIPKWKVGRWVEAKASQVVKWQKLRADQMVCPDCKEIVNIIGRDDLMLCPQCGSTVPTGLEDQLRDELEVWKTHLPYPKAAVARASAYAAGIYRLATHRKAIQRADIEKQIGNQFGVGTTAKEQSDTFELFRKFLGCTDKGTGVLIFRVSGKDDFDLDWNQTYVVFRGSRGEIEGVENERGAGWAEFEENNQAVMHNIDWTANFKNYQQDPPDWAPGTRVHSGFLELYMSVADEVLHAVQDLDARNVIVAGHSLGGALATVCAHHLQYNGLEPFCFAFNSPRAGNLAFVKDFNTKIATQQAEIGGGEEGAFFRSFLFHRWSDVVSTLGEHGFDSPMAQAVADSGSIAQQGARAQSKIDSPTVIYYHPKNRWKLGNKALPADSHAYTLVEEQFLGQQFSE